ncbi:helix-turn-helix domain-containing protein, partial [Vibrio parahaemolyticus]
LRGQAVADVSRELNLPERFILAIEADDYAQLPELAFVRGYLRRYAQLVRLSPDEIVLRFEEHFASRGRVPEAAATGRVNPIQLLG